MSAFCYSCLAPMDALGDAHCPQCGLPRPSHGWPRDARLGTLVAGGQYRVLRRLGAGGFGVVYLVETVVGGLRRALKVLHTEWASDPAARDRFVNEALIVEQVNHPNVARCYAAGALDDDALYLLMELVEGIPLTALVEAGPARGPLAPARAVRLAKQVASGLVAAHATRVLHRDLTPQNILVIDAGTPDEHVKIVDFGIARSIDATAASTRGILGTPGYLPPERLRSGEVVDARSDLWQLGAVLFYLLTGRPPLASADGSLADAMRLHERWLDAGPAPSSVVPALAASAALDGFVARLLATRRERRPRSAAQACAQLAHIESSLAPTDAPGALALIEALCAVPGEGGWWALCRYLSEAPDRQFLVEAADALLASWPDTLRLAPTAWWEAVRRGEAHALWPLARTLDLSRRELAEDDVHDLAECQAVSSLTRLALAGNGLDDAAARRLAASPHLRGLVALDLSHNRLTSDGAAAIAASAHLVNLAELSLANNGLGARGAAAIAQSGLALRVLDLGDNDLRAEGAAAIAGSPALGGLEVLRLARNGIGSDGAGALAVSRTLTSLAELDLAGNGIGPGGAAALALCPNVSRLHTLRLGANALGRQGIELLVASNRFTALERLDITGNQIGASGAMALAASPFARRVKTLDVADNQLGDAGLAALLGATPFAGLRALGLARNELTAGGMTLVAGAPPELESLELAGNDIGTAGAGALAQALERSRVATLDLSHCGLDGRSLAAVLGGGRITTLKAARNPLDAAGVDAVASSDGAHALECLELGGAPFGLEGIEALARGRLPQLRRLRLEAVGLADADAEAALKALGVLPSLQWLALPANDLGAATAAAIAASPIAARLAVLDLSHNRIGDAGASALARGAHWHMLHTLVLDDNGLGAAGAATIVASSALALLARVDLAHNAQEGSVDLHSLGRHRVALLEASFGRVAALGTDFAETVYRKLFERHPGVKPLFARVPMKLQSQHLMQTLVMVIDRLRQPDVVAEQLRQLSLRHVGYGVFPSQYFALNGIILEALREALGEDWNDEVDDAWREGLEALTRVMLEAHRTATSMAAPAPRAVTPTV